jgi:hypothetical protein
MAVEKTGDPWLDLKEMEVENGRLVRENDELRDKVATLETVVRKLKELVDVWI